MSKLRDAIALPGTGSVADAELGAAVGTWIRSWPVRELVALSGWSWPSDRSDRDLAQTLADRSADWDFRGRAAAAAGTNFVERSSMPGAAPLVLAGREVDPERVVGAARALRLVESQTELEFPPTHVVVLAGTARANVNRTRFAAAVLGAAGARPSAIVGLSAHRELRDAERASCVDLGMHPTDTEWTTLRDALTVAFGLSSPTVEENRPDVGTRADRFARAATYRWPSDPPVELLVVPSPYADDPQPRPADTTDQLREWTTRAGGPTSSSAVLIVTTQIYVPYQQLSAVRVLRTAAPGAKLLTVGVAAETATVPTRAFTAQDYLQEVRAALIVARDLLDDLAQR